MNRECFIFVTDLLHVFRVQIFFLKVVFLLILIYKDSPISNWLPKMTLRHDKKLLVLGLLWLPLSKVGQRTFSLRAKPICIVFLAVRRAYARAASSLAITLRLHFHTSSQSLALLRANTS